MIALPERDPTATRLYLVRHAAAAIEPGRCCGSLDVDLSAAGRKHARALGRAFAEIELDAVYTSPLERSRQTAAEIASRRGLSLRELRGVAEIDFGELEGKDFDEIAVTHPETHATWLTQPTEVDFPGGERFADFARRVRQSVHEILSAHRGEQVAVVSHGGPIRLLLADALAMPTPAMFRLDQAHAAVNVLDWHDDTPLVRLLNAGVG